MSEIQKYTFDTDISSLLNLIINNFYSNKDIFLRELLSNASDSIDRYNYNSITNKIDDKIQNKITIIPNKDNKQLLIIDTGDAMNKDDLIKNIGTIANSGTKAFMEKAKDTNLIGKFGVGFYSAFLVSDKVTIISNKNNEIWKLESDATNNYIIEKLDSFTINDDIDFKQGTIIQLSLKEDLINTYTDTTKLKNVTIERITPIKWVSHAGLGGLVVSDLKNNSDTIFVGEWGKPPKIDNIKELIIDNKQYLSVKWNYIGGQSSTAIFWVYSLEKDSFLGE